MVKHDRAAILSRRARFVAATLIGVGCTPAPAPREGGVASAAEPPVIEVPTEAPTAALAAPSVPSARVEPEAPPPKPPPSKVCTGSIPAQRTPDPPPGVCLSMAMAGFHAGLLLPKGNRLDEAAHKQLDEVAPLVKSSRLLELIVDETDAWREIGASVQHELVMRGVPSEIICVRDPSGSKATRDLKDNEAILSIMLGQR